MEEFEFHPLNEWELLFRGAIKASTLRKEVLAGNIRAIRSRPGCNAKILISVKEMKRWLQEVASKRTIALSPSMAAEANRRGRCGHGE
ncbi:MAG: hypothetical protein H6839_03740 [Planctomycetes bacterium]|nr:hypothetical protein [Planctomycetota bacterium]MCB9893542.1 hypothetical protein [Planctomycetota bacterium]